MFISKRIRRNVTAWIALLAILCQAMVPTLAQARAAASATPWAQICSVANIAADSADQFGHASSPLKTLHAGHCSFCLSLGEWLLPGSGDGFVGPAKAHTLYEAAPAPGRIASQACTSPPPRGPPPRA
ncbi:hypothetical protein AAKU55_002000 [Oxalobacteraceae bacterium GrIS 1.11]